eukprot:72859-Chlamydomonas_euryale.AAC.4
MALTTCLRTAACATSFRGLTTQVRPSGTRGGRGLVWGRTGPPDDRRERQNAGPDQARSAPTPTLTEAH